MIGNSRLGWNALTDHHTDSTVLVVNIRLRFYVYPIYLLRCNVNREGLGSG